jgi:hypothetical protein
MSESFVSDDRLDAAGIFMVSGESAFLSSLLHGDEKLTPLLSRELATTLNKALAKTPVSKEEMVAGILALFRLQERCAASKGYPSHVGGPYLIYRITTQGILRIH